MTRLLRAELLKIRTTRLYLGLTIGSVALGVLNVVAVILASRRADTSFLLTPARFAAIGANAYVFAGAPGVLAMAGETRHHTADHTFLATPNRSRVIAVKAAAVWVAGALMALLTEAVVFAVGLSWLAAIDIHLEFEAVIWLNVAAQAAGVGLIGVLGVALGSILRHQVAALLVLVGWLFIGENIVRLIFEGVGDFLLSNTLAAMVGGNEDSDLPRWRAALLAVSYVLAFGGLGGWLLERRDVT